MPEPHSIDSVTVQVDGGPAVDADLTGVPDRRRTIVLFTATLQVTGGGDLHVITATAINDMGRTVETSVSVFTGTPYAVAAPALVLELRPAPFDPTQSGSQAAANLLVSQIQVQLTAMASLLASHGATLAGPNLVLAGSPQGTVLRIGMWIVGPGFPLVASRPPDLPLPVLPAEGATAGFATVPLLPLPTPSGAQLFAFGASIPSTTLQMLVDAMFPTLKALAARKGINLDSVTVACSSPGSVSTTFSGSAGWPSSPIGGTITEVMSTVAVPGSSPPQSVPAITSSSFTSSASVLADALLGFICPLFSVEALVLTIAVPIGVGSVAGQANSIATSIVRSIPARVPFRNTVSLLLPDFPMILPTWTAFGTTNSGMLGLGLVSILGRDQSMVGLSLSGPAGIVGYQSDLAGGADQTYGVGWPNLVPDSNKFAWSVSGFGSDGGPIGLESLAQAGSFVATFPLPDPLRPGDYAFTLAASATETSASNPSLTLTAMTSLPVRVHAARDPLTRP